MVNASPLQRLNTFLRRTLLPKVIYQPEAKGLTTGGRMVILSSLAAGLCVTGLKVLQVLEPAELFIFDRLVRIQPDQDLNPRITIIGIGEQDVQQYGWPLLDDQLAVLLQAIQAHQPRVIGLDIYRSTPRPPGSEALVEQLAAENLVAIKNVGTDPTFGDVPPPPTVPSDRIGFNDFPTDLDGIIRRNLLLVGKPETGNYSFGLRVVLTDNRHNPLPLRADDTHLYLGDQPIPVLLGAEGGYQAVDSSGYQILLRYHSHQSPTRQLSISQVLSGQFDPAWITDQVVLIGTTAPSMKDLFYTPFSFAEDEDLKMAGVVIHAQMISQLLDVIDGKPALYRYLPPWGEVPWLLAWCLGAGVLVWGYKRPSLMLGASGGLLLAVVGLGWVTVQALIWVPLAEPIMGILITTAVVMAYKLLYRSTHDPLTGLPNRESFLTLVQRALHQRQGNPEVNPVIVVFMGIDRFKVINESLGHQAGDEVLRVIAHRLLKHRPLEAEVARGGGDEFALVLTTLDNERASGQMDALQYVLSEPIMLQGQKVPSTISMGMAISQPGRAHRAADLLRDAHTAMYRAKALGKSRFEVFAAGMFTEAVNRLQLESDLISALDNQEFLLYYQPIIRLATGELAGFEALVRWHQKDRGFVLPGAFIPAAEETGLIMALGQWIFREACRQLHTWHGMFPQHPNLTMSINLSNRQFGQADLISQVKAALQDTQVRGDCVRLEITESMVMGDVDAAIDLMLKLKSLDLMLAIDDFGTGYSSLSYLHRFPMDTLKVDKSFVGRLEKSNEDRAIIHTILTLGQKLGMEVVAEGVETLDQVTMLKQQHCDYGQGYFFAKPLPVEEAQALLAYPRLPSF